MATPLTRRNWLIFAAFVATLVAAGATFWLLHRTSGPNSVLLLPDGDAVLFLNLRPIRLGTHFGDKPVTREPEYDQFVQATGFQFERDLDEVALVVHRPEVAVEGDKTSLERRYSEVFVGRYDHAKVSNYLKSLAATMEQTEGKDVYVIPHEGRTVRVTLLSNDTVAVSNSSDAGNLRHIIQTFNGTVVAAGPSLFRDFYKRVPFASGAWAIARMSTPDGGAASVPLPGGMSFSLPKDTVTVVSLGVNASLATAPSVQFKAEAITPSAADAKQVTENVSSFLQLFKSVEAASRPGGPDPDVKQFFDSLQMQQQDASAVLTAQVPVGFLKKVMSEGQEIAAPQPAQQEQAPAGKDGKKNAKPNRRSAR